uniref:Mitochondrial inner membrane protease ATP23 homolog n=1 Tax=Macrostomum lignano TaxID=282301 RepID=A0A1I8HFU2_9PLAT
MPSERQPSSASTAADESSASKSAPSSEDYGYSVFPKRDPGADYKAPARFIGFRAWRHNRCLKNVLDCSMTDPFIRYLIVAIRSRGCSFTLSRNVSCERCRFSFSGGYDPMRKQVAVCENEFWAKPGICSVLRHELIHAFDDCRAVMFKGADEEAKEPNESLDRLACTEIRAASLNHCMLGAAKMEGYTGMFNYAGQHQHCVKSKALMSVLAARQISRPEGEAAIERVFDRCYADLEPFGRIPASLKSFRSDCDRFIIDGARMTPGRAASAALGRLASAAKNPSPIKLSAAFILPSAASAVSVLSNTRPPPLMLPPITIGASSIRRSFCTAGGGKCWKCSQPAGGDAGGLFCAACGAIQAPDEASSCDHYRLLFGPQAEPKYRVDLTKLATAMRQLQWQLHPDKFASASDEERSLAQQQSARVNSAYRCLADPVLRAVYLLSLRGVAMPTEETGSGRSADGGDLSLPQEFLSEMLELNEALMEADHSSIGSIADRVEADTASLTEELAKAFDDANDLSLAKELTYRLKYFTNIRAKVRERT